jgi:hypothetical protein
MEYERAIYRVYERCMEGIREEMEPSAIKYCLIMEYVCIGCAVFFTVVLAMLHSQFATSDPSNYCLETLLLQQNITSLGADEILYINIDPRFRADNELGLGADDFYKEEANQQLAKRRRKLFFLDDVWSDYLSDILPTNIQFMNNYLNVDTNKGKGYLPSVFSQVQPRRRRSQQSQQQAHAPPSNNGHMLPYSHINSWLSAYGRRFFAGSKIQQLLFPTSYTEDSSPYATTETPLSASSPSAGTADASRRVLIGQQVSSGRFAVTDGNRSQSANSTNSTILPMVYPSYDYEFAFDVAILALSMEQRVQHNFKSVNVTFVYEDPSPELPTWSPSPVREAMGRSADLNSGASNKNIVVNYQCFGKSSLTQSLLTSVGSLDVVILNNIVHTIKKAGRHRGSREKNSMIVG